MMQTAMKTTMFLIAAVGIAHAAEPAAKAKGESAAIKPVLTPDRKVQAVIKSLGENQSTLLPPVKTTGPINAALKKFGMHKNGPGPRNYCWKWVWAADRKRALFCGANAGAPHRFNDLWEYDLASNTWVLLYEPQVDFLRISDEQKKNVGLVKNGILTVKTGAPFDPVHSWWQITYEPDMKALLWVMGNYNKCKHPHRKNAMAWGKLWMFAYYPAENRWDNFVPGKSHPPGMNASILEYLPDRKRVLWYTNTWRGGTTSLFDGEKKTWKHLVGKGAIRGNPNCPGSEAIAAYDSHRKLLVVHHGGGTHKGKPRPKVTYHFDVEKKEWKRVFVAKQGPDGLDMRASMTYDSDSKRCFVIHNGLWSYAPGEGKWTRHAPRGPKPPNGMLCYNPKHKVLMIKPGGSRVWVYRPGKVEGIQPAPATPGTGAKTNKRQ